MMHIKKCDILLNYLKYMLACFYWYNIFVLLALKYIDEDMEILCDKLVINKMGGSNLAKREYLETMYKLSTVENKNVNSNYYTKNKDLSSGKVFSLVTCNGVEGTIERLVVNGIVTKQKIMF